MKPWFRRRSASVIPDTAAAKAPAIPTAVPAHTSQAAASEFDGTSASHGESPALHRTLPQDAHETPHRQQPNLPVSMPADLGVPILTVHNVERSFQVGGEKLDVLKSITMELQPQQLVMLKGRSGSGKTTLLNIIGGLDQPNRGEVVFQGQPFHLAGDEDRTRIRRRDIGFIFQSYALLPLLSAWENVELSLRMAGTPKDEWKSRVTHCLELVGLGKRMHHRPFELSGGEQQRVAIAKAIAHRPSLLLADEPTAELDSQMGAQVMAVFRDIIRSENVTICMTTHDPTILEVADHVYEMVDGTFVS